MFSFRRCGIPEGPVIEDSKLPDTRAMRRVRALSQSLAAPEDS
ncbi:hypothetical protein ACVW0B_001987 [Thermostichus sp. MS-CIW-23]